MSKVKKELMEATEVTARRGESDDDVKVKILEAVSKLNDKEWEKLSNKAQDWYNDAADAISEKKDIPNFPDEEVKEETKTSRRGAAKKEEVAEPEESKEEKEPEDEPDVGDNVIITNKRGKEFKGEIIEFGKDLVVIKTAEGEEMEISLDRVETIAKQEEAKKSSSKKSSAKDEEEKADDGEGNLAVMEDDEVIIKTKRGKEITGKIVEIDGDLIILEDKKGDEVEVLKSSIESLKHLKVNTAPEKTTSRRGSKEKEPEKEEAKESTGKKKESSAGNKVTKDDNGGTSVTLRMRELILDDTEATVETIKKQLEKEKLAFRDNTLTLVYADVHKLLKLMKARKMLK